jgi:thiol-disulfide isomerase/thioredoxin
MNRTVRNALLGAAASAIVIALLGAYALNRAPRGEADVAIIAHGERVDLQAHAVAGKYTVFDFYAVWCPPCRVLGPALEKLASRNAQTLAIRKVDIVDWTMPVAEQYGVQELPYLVLYDSSGRKVADGEKVYESLNELFGKDALDLDRATEKPPTSAM